MDTQLDNQSNNEKDFAKIIAAIVNDFDIERIKWCLDTAAQDLDAKYCKHLELFDEAVLLVFGHGNDNIADVDEAVKLVNKLVSCQIINTDTAKVLLASKVRKIGMLAFPFWIQSKAIVEFARTNVDRYRSIIDNLSVHPRAKQSLIKWCDFVNSPLTNLCYGSACLTETDAENLKSLVRSIDITSIQKDYVATPTGKKFGACPNLDIGQVATRVANSISHVFASNICPGGGAFSLLGSFGGQEEMILQQSIVLGVVAMHVVGQRNMTGEESGKCTWLHGLEPLNEMIACRVNTTTNTWVAFIAMNDQREAKLTTDQQHQNVCRIINTLLLCARKNGLKAYTGEIGTGIYGGDIDTCINSIIHSADPDLVIACWSDAWYKSNTGPHDKTTGIPIKKFRDDVTEASFKVSPI